MNNSPLKTTQTNFLEWGLEPTRFSEVRHFRFGGVGHVGKYMMKDLLALAFLLVASRSLLPNSAQKL